MTRADWPMQSRGILGDIEALFASVAKRDAALDARRRDGELLIKPGEWLLMHPDDVRAMAGPWQGEPPKLGDRYTLEPGAVELRIAAIVPRGNVIIMPGVERKRRRVRRERRRQVLQRPLSGWGAGRGAGA